MDLSEVECAVPGSRYIPYTPVNGTWLHAAEDRPWLGYADPRRRDGRCDDARLGAGGHVDLKLGHHAKDGVEIIDVQAKSTCIPRRGCGSCSSTWSARAATSSSSTWTRSGSSTPPASGYWSGPEAGAGPRPLAGSGLHAAADPENLEDHRTDGSLRHLRDRGPGHRGEAGPPVRNAPPGAKQPRASGPSAGRHGHTPGLRNKRSRPDCQKRRLCNVFSGSLRAASARSGRPPVIM